jgi:hypothetical protein
MNQIELLTETERAAGGVELLEQHQNLIKLKNEQMSQNTVWKRCVNGSRMSRPNSNT